MPESQPSVTSQWIAELIKAVGFPIVVCLFLFFGAWKLMQQDREQLFQYQEEIKEDKVYVRDTLAEKLDDSTKAIENNTEVLRQLKEE